MMQIRGPHSLLQPPTPSSGPLENVRDFSYKLQSAYNKHETSQMHVSEDELFLCYWKQRKAPPEDLPGSEPQLSKLCGGELHARTALNLGRLRPFVFRVSQFQGLVGLLLSTLRVFAVAFWHFEESLRYAGKSHQR